MTVKPTILFQKLPVLFFLLLQTAPACKEKYTPHTNYPYTGYLVVDGFMDAGGVVSRFKLSRTTALDSAYYVPVTGASLAIEDSSGGSFPVYEQGGGEYAGYGIQLTRGTRYRLHILASDAREYYSDYTDVHITPGIDSVSWQEKNSGVQVYVSAHDPANTTHFYKWRFDETWKYTAKYFSSLIWDPNGLDRFRYRTEAEQLYTCWKSDTSSNILIGSTLKLASDVLADQPVTFIPYSEPFSKLYYKYSINVYMEALGQDEYEWYDKLRKNTESLGSIFDAQPSELSGNVHSVTDPTETVIGWVGSHSVTQSRIFISRGQLPSNPRLDDGYDYCSEDTLIFGKDDQAIQDAYSAGEYQLPISYYTKKGSFNPTGIIGSSSDCTDCRTKGGVLLRPDFWQD